MRILVTDSHELAGLGALRSLGRASHEVIAGFPADLRRPPASYSRFCSGHRAYPNPWRSLPDFRQWLVRHAGEFDLILPVSEAALFAASCSRSEIPSSTIVVVPPVSSLEYVLSKRRATQKAIAIGMLCPATAFSPEDVEGLKPPFVVRTDNRLMPDGSYQKGRTRYVEIATELAELLSELDGNGDRWIVQESVIGKGAGAFLLRWGDQACLTFAHERVHEVPFYGGWSSLRKSVHSPEMIQAGSRLLSCIGFQGAAMVEFKRIDGAPAPCFIEINGRLWGSLALALHAGVDFPKVLVECHAGRHVTAGDPNYPAGMSCRNVYPGETSYLSSVLKAKGPMRGVRPPGKLSALLECAELFCSGNIRYDYFWPRDPLPWVSQSIHAVEHVLTSVWGRAIRKARRTWLIREFIRKHRKAAPDLSKVLFLCYGNICRSALAEAYWNSHARCRSRSRSAGLHPVGDRPSPVGFRGLARRFGADLETHRSRVVDAESVDWATAIFVMDGENIEGLLRVFPGAHSKAWLLGPFADVAEIRDPYGLNETEAEGSLRQIIGSIDVLAEPGPVGTASGYQPLSSVRRVDRPESL